MNKTHVPDSPNTGRQCHNCQLVFHFYAIRSARQSVGSSVGTSVGSSAGSSARTRNIVRFFLVTPKNVSYLLEIIKHDELYLIQSLNMNYTYLMAFIPFYHEILQKAPLKYEKCICLCAKNV
jgi:hypothetical protein